MDKKTPFAKQQDPLHQACAAAVKSLLNRSGYSFLAEDIFIENVYARVRLEAPASDKDRAAYIINICKNVYARELYKGCAGADRLKQNQAYTELGNYLYKIAVHFLLTRGCPAELADSEARDRVQQTLKNIFEHILEIKEPGGFLDYAIRAVTRECARNFSIPIQSLAGIIEKLPVSGITAKKEITKVAGQLRNAARPGSSLAGLETMIESLKQTAAGEPHIQKEIDWITRQLRQSSRAGAAETLDDRHEALPAIPRQDGCKLDCVLNGLAKIENKEQRILLVLQYFSEFDDRQIAILLNTNSNNIYQVRRRAIQNFDREAVAHCIQEC